MLFSVQGPAAFPAAVCWVFRDLKVAEMTGYTVHTGASKKFVSGWDRVFGDQPQAGQKAGAQTGRKAAQAAGAAAKKAAGKKSAARKAAGKKKS